MFLSVSKVPGARRKKGRKHLCNYVYICCLSVPDGHNLQKKKANLTTFTITDMHTHTYCCHSSMGEEQKICHNIILSNPWGKRLDLNCRDLANLLSSSFHLLAKCSHHIRIVRVPLYYY